MSLDDAGERTEIWYGEDKVMKGLVKYISKVNGMLDICADALAPSFSMGVKKIRNGYDDFKRKGVKIRYITEITRRNLHYCKQLMEYAELRHMDSVKGNISVTETEYIYSNCKNRKRS